MLPSEFESKLCGLLGAEYPQFLAAYDRPRAVGLRFNPLKTCDLPELPFGLTPVSWAAHGYYYDGQARPGLHPYHDAGLYYLQEPSAMAPAMLLDAQPGERVLDLCAAPGGKSTQLAAAMAGKGLLVSNEIHPKRARILAQNIERMGISNALVLNEAPDRLAERFGQWFDKILVDAPCSGEGMFRKEAAAVTDWSPETVQMCAARQLEILLRAASMLRPGGRLVYSTCTFSPEENEGVISAFLRRAPMFSVEPVPAPWFAPGRPDWVREPAAGLEQTFRLWPHLLRGEGHYAAVLRRDDGPRRSSVPLQPSEPLPAVFSEFARLLPPLPEGQPLLFGQRLFWAPEELPSLRGLRVLRAGLELGELRKGRFEPAQALALWLKSAGQTQSFSADSDELRRYLRGETLPTDHSGWVLVQVDGYSLGWGKGAGGILKNHYPKGLRRL